MRTMNRESRPCDCQTRVLRCSCLSYAGPRSLLQVVLYHRHACEAVNEDSLLELADWGVRKLAYLNTDAHKAAAAKGEARTTHPAACLHDMSGLR